MIKWILEGKLGTLPFEELELPLMKHAKVLDVRDLVDKSGNTPEEVRRKIDQAVHWLNAGEKVLICCDHGISRSNAVAVGVLAIYQDIEISKAAKTVVDATGERAIRLEVLNSVRLALGAPPKGDSPDTNNILMTGASGGIGKPLLKQLELGYSVCAPSHQEIDLLSDLVALDSLVKERRIGTIIHLGAPRAINTNHSLSNDLLMLKNVLDVCGENNLRLLFLSSWEIYSGYKGPVKVVNESTRPFAATTYGMTKLLSEELIYQYGQSLKMVYIILRPTVIYGTGGSKPHFLANFINKARQNETITTHQYLNGLPFLDLLHISDLVQAIQSSLDLTGPSTLNLGSGKLISTRDIAASVIYQLGSKSVIEQTEINERVAQISYDVTWARRQLEWQACVSWQDGVKELVGS